MSAGGVALALAFWLLLGGGTVAGGEPDPAPGERAGRLELATYRASVFSYRVEGSLLWLAGPDGLMRWEIRRGRPVRSETAFVADLIAREGQGWTAVLGGGGDETLNPWAGAWQTPPPGLGQAAALIASALAAGPPAALSEPGIWRGCSTVRAARHHQIRSLGREAPPQPGRSEFRREATRRGLGRGGGREMLELSWSAADADGVSWLRVHSTRRPGQLELAPRGTRPVVYAMPEAFVPLWPLSVLVEFVP